MLYLKIKQKYSHSVSPFNLKRNFLIFFTVVMHKEKEENGMLSHMHHHDTYRSRELGVFENGLLDGEMFLQVSFYSHIL